MHYSKTKEKNAEVVKGLLFSSDGGEYLCVNVCSESIV